MKGSVGNIEDLTDDNTDFRGVIYTGKKLQLVLMNIQPGGEIGEEVHDGRDHFFRIEEGEGEVLIDGNRSKTGSDDAVLIPSGARHSLVKTGSEPLPLCTIHGTFEHRDETTKADAHAAEEHFDEKLLSRTTDPEKRLCS